MVALCLPTRFFGTRASTALAGSPPFQGIDGRSKLPATIGERVLHPRRHFGVDGARYKSGRLELAQPRRDHLRIRVNERTFYLGKSARTVEQITNDEQGPLMSDDRKCARELIHLFTYFIVTYLLFASIT